MRTVAAEVAEAIAGVTPAQVIVSGKTPIAVAIVAIGAAKAVSAPADMKR